MLPWTWHCCIHMSSWWQWRQCSHTSFYLGQAQNCWMIRSIGSRHTGHGSPLAFNTRAHIRQHAMCPVSPWTMVLFLTSVRQIKHFSSLLRSGGAARCCCCCKVFLDDGCSFALAASWTCCDWSKCHSPGAEGSKDLSILINSKMGWSFGGGLLSRTLTHPPCPASFNRSMHDSWGWSENARATTVSTVLTVAKPIWEELNSTLARMMAPSASVTLNNAGSGKGTGCAIGPRWPDSGLRNSLIHPSTSCNSSSSSKVRSEERRVGKEC